MKNMKVTISTTMDIGVVNKIHDFMAHTGEANRSACTEKLILIGYKTWKGQQNPTD